MHLSLGQSSKYVYNVLFFRMASRRIRYAVGRRIVEVLVSFACSFLGSRFCSLVISVWPSVVAGVSVHFPPTTPERPRHATPSHPIHSFTSPNFQFNLVQNHTTQHIIHIILISCWQLQHHTHFRGTKRRISGFIVYFSSSPNTSRSIAMVKPAFRTHWSRRIERSKHHPFRRILWNWTKRWETFRRI